jgi:AmmeMemoRadiSam system protein B
LPIRRPAVAGVFYPDDPERCRFEVDHYLKTALSSAVETSAQTKVLGGLAPHAGWSYSGAVAARSLGLVADADVQTVIVFGAVHRLRGRGAAVYSSGSWITPVGEIRIDEEFARDVLKASPHFVEDLEAHGPEHSIEVEVPFLQAAAPSATLLPIMMPPIAEAAQLGRIVAQCAQALGRRVLFFASSDLTHYGPRFEFVPAGIGDAGIRWAKDVNDRRLLDRVVALDAEGIVPEAREHQNACGPGAIAATIAACQELGATRGFILEHTSSSEVLARGGETMVDAVGYASAVFA